MSKLAWTTEGKTQPFVADGTGTRMTMRISLPDAKNRKAMLAFGMDRGKGASYARVERLSGWRLAS
jgi:hypothetical protein